MFVWKLISQIWGILKMVKSRRLQTQNCSLSLSLLCESYVEILLEVMGFESSWVQGYLASAAVLSALPAEKQTAHFKTFQELGKEQIWHLKEFKSFHFHSSINYLLPPKIFHVFESNSG